jgi:Cu/Zn superoxide dismutase
MVIAGDLLPLPVFWTGFHVWRKDSNEGSYDNITTSATSAGVMFTTDTVTEAKKYWYRVSANNSYGESTRSKVIPVVVE